MKTLNQRFFLTLTPLIMALCSLFINDSFAAPRAALRGTAGARQPVAKTTVQTTTVETPAPVLTEPEPIEQTVPAVNKANRFDNIISSSITTSTSGDDEIAERIRARRAALDTQDATSAVETQRKSGRNACDVGLRTCMEKTCGTGFINCATDGDTVFGDKLNKCKRDLNCTGEEFRLFTTEIKADRDMNVRLSSYNAVIDCGVAYNDCIFTECGETFDKCLGKSAADKATKACKQIADKCKEQDSGLPGRFGNVIGRLRENAEQDVKADEERLYKLRDLMRGTCEKLGAAFDERTFDCVYTVNFYAGKDQETPMASRKRYAGNTFVCTQEWFGIDVTTFKENAYRETRAQTGASSAMLGAGLGTAAGLIASGAISRAIDRQKAEKELDKAQSDKDKLECENKGSDYLYVDGKCHQLGEECKKTYGNGVGKVEKDGDKLVCKLDSCDLSGYKVSKDGTSCTIIGSKSADAAKCEEEGNIWSNGKCNKDKDPCTTILGSGKGEYMEDDNGKLYCYVRSCGPTFEPNDDHTGCRSSVGRKKAEKVAYDPAKDDSLSDSAKEIERKKEVSVIEKELSDTIFDDFVPEDIQKEETKEALKKIKDINKRYQG